MEEEDIRFVCSSSLLETLAPFCREKSFLDTTVVCQDGVMRLNLLLLSFCLPELGSLAHPQDFPAAETVVFLPEMSTSEILESYQSIFKETSTPDYKCDDTVEEPDFAGVVVQDSAGEVDPDSACEFAEFTESSEALKFGCNMCEFRSSVKLDLALHRKYRHAGLLKKCDICEYSTSSKSRFNRHKNSHHDVPRIMCDQCEYKAADLSTLNSHISSRHTGSEYFCDLCPFKAKWARSITRHRQTVHEGLKDTYLCDQCHYKTSQHASLKRHIKVMHEADGSVKQYKRYVEGAAFCCDQCDFKAKYSRSVKRHKQSVHEGTKQFQCAQCDYKSTQDATLKRHIRLVHEKKAEENRNQSQEIDYNF